MPRFALTTAYHGKYYAGWQRQDQVRNTVQEVLENICAILNKKETPIFCAGRTDSGVHALGQVFHVDIERDITPNKLLLAINGHLLKEHIAITHCTLVNDDFHARFGAKKRYYRYRILNRLAIACLEKEFVWHYPRTLDIEAMQEGASHFIGQHDLTSFRSSACQALSPIKTIETCDITKQGEEVIIDVAARSFMYRQVRNMVGTLCEVGRGYIPPPMIKDIILAKDRSKAGPTAPAQGLVFYKVDYS